MDRPKGWFMATTEESLSELLDQLNTRTIEDPSGSTLIGFWITTMALFRHWPPDFSNADNVNCNNRRHYYCVIYNWHWQYWGKRTQIQFGPQGTSSINWPKYVGGIYHNPAMEVNQGGQVSLKGDNADIDINGKSLVKTWMQAMEERMNWMQPNVELEKEWDDLRRLGERYRKLEKKCREKADMWKKLKSMPRPDLP
jgi:hypothetical protein